MLGSRVDAALSDFFPIRTRRAELRLPGNNGVPPAWYEVFLGPGKLIGEAAHRAQITFDKSKGKLDTRQLYHAANILTPDGKKFRQITIDARDKGQIPTIIQRERRRHGLRPLSAQELAIAASEYAERTVNNPIVQKSVDVSFAYLRHAVIKIAYELAFLWLGDGYLTDAVASKLREAVCHTDLASTDKIEGHIGEADNFEVFNKFWIPHRQHHLAYGSVLPGKGLVVCVRIFDIYAGAIVVSHDPSRYLANIAEHAKLRFLAIDSVSGTTINTSFGEESRRLAEAMAKHRCTPPFPDPLTLVET